MASGLQAERVEPITPQGGDPRVELVGCGGDGARLQQALEARGFAVTLAESPAEPRESDKDAVIALWLSTDLARAMSGSEDTLRQATARAATVLICSRIRPGDLRIALSAGAFGVVLESEVDVALPIALQAAHAGQVCVPRSHVDQIEPASLSPREKQILGLVVMGYMNCQIAEQLFVAESTVKSHLSSAFAKLGVRSRTEAAELIMDPERGLGIGILGLGGEPVETAARAGA